MTFKSLSFNIAVTLEANGRSNIDIPGLKNLTEAEQQAHLRYIRRALSIPAPISSTSEDIGSFLSRLHITERQPSPLAETETRAKGCLASSEPASELQKASTIRRQILRNERTANQELKEFGCPACYPVGLKLVPKQLPSKYQGIVDYWTKYRGQSNVLQAQLQEWKHFCQDRAILPGHPALSADPKHLESRLRLWLRYECWHCYRQRHLLFKAKEEEMAFGRGLLEQEIESDVIGLATRNQRLHEVWLGWIRQQIEFIRAEIALRDKLIELEKLT